MISGIPAGHNGPSCISKLLAELPKTALVGGYNRDVSIEKLVRRAARSRAPQSVSFRRNDEQTSAPVQTWCSGWARGREEMTQTVIWATGYRVDHSWIDAPVFDENGRVVHRRGVTQSPGLYFLGLSWLTTRGSALIGWVKDDAEYLAQKISALQFAAPPEQREPERVG